MTSNVQVRRNATEFALDHPLYIWVVVLACIWGGLYSINNMARLEDPPYPIKMAYVVTEYPGASALEVEQEVTERLEASLQELPWTDKVISRSVIGRSEIQVELRMDVAASDTEQIWDVLRRRVAEAAQLLPPTAGTPWVEDDFSDVFGLLYAVNIPEGYSSAAIYDLARRLQVELKRVPHVSKVQIEGLPEDVLYVEFDPFKITNLGLSPSAILAAINSRIQLGAAAFMDVGHRRLRIDAPSTPDSEQHLRDIKLSQPGSPEMIRLGDVASVQRREPDEPHLLIRHNGARSFTVGVAVNESQNIVDVGATVEAALAHQQNMLPAGVQIQPIYQQHRVVEASVNDFLLNLGASIATVILALCLFMGWRPGMVVGVVLLLTVLGTLAVMNGLDIQLQRISLGAMMIAMGMLVDNAIVVAEGMLTGIQRGTAPRTAAVDAVQSTRFPLLGATIIGVAAFAPIGLSSDSTGEYLGSLFQVAAISLLLSWIFAITVVPSVGLKLIRPPATARSEEQIYSRTFYRTYRGVLSLCIRHRWLAMLFLLSVLLASFWGGGQLKQGFFPSTNTPMVFVDLFLPEGTGIRHTDTVAQDVAATLSQHSDVVATTNWVGRGPSRFIMILLPERADAAYAQVVLHVADVEQLDAVKDWAEEQISREFPGIDFSARRVEFSPGSAYKLEARFSGMDPIVLRQLAEQAEAIFRKHAFIDLRTDWREPQVGLSVAYDELRGRRFGIDSDDIANGLAFNTDGVVVGALQDEDKLVPIRMRLAAPATTPAELHDRLIWSASQQQYIPLSQVVTQIEPDAENGIIQRRNRLRTITAQANPRPDQTAAEAFAAIRPEVEALALPLGYELNWGGEFEANKIAQENLGSRFPIAMGVMILTTLLLFGKVRETLVVWLTVPMVLAGVVAALLAAQLSFTFPALLGLLSLVGILLKNCIILVEEIDYRVQRGQNDSATLIAACVSRLRPVMLAAGTTVAGMAPLLADSFFREMAVSIMGGLALGSVLSLISVPVLYSLFYHRGVRSTESKTSV